MIIVDASVWIDYYHPRENVHTVWLDQEIGRRDLGLTDMILCEVLQGTRTDSIFEERLRSLLQFEVFDTGGKELAIASSKNYRQLRVKGLTIRTAVDCLIATFCIEQGYTLLHRDRDFDAFERHLGLDVLHPAIQ